MCTHRPLHAGSNLRTQGLTICTAREVSGRTMTNLTPAAPGVARISSVHASAVTQPRQVHDCIKSGPAQASYLRALLCFVQQSAEPCIGSHLLAESILQMAAYAKDRCSTYLWGPGSGSRSRRTKRDQMTLVQPPSAATYAPASPHRHPAAARLVRSKLRTDKSHADHQTIRRVTMRRLVPLTITRPIIQVVRSIRGDAHQGERCLTSAVASPLLVAHAEQCRACCLVGRRPARRVLHDPEEGGRREPRTHHLEHELQTLPAPTARQVKTQSHLGPKNPCALISSSLNRRFVDLSCVCVCRYTYASS